MTVTVVQVDLAQSYNDGLLENVRAAVDTKKAGGNEVFKRK